MRVAKTFSDGTSLGWDRGSMDDWCVYMINPDGSTKPPKDVDYFTELLFFADKYGHKRVYDDFVKMYDVINSKNPDECHIEIIEEIVKSYPVEDQLAIDKLFTILWMAMVSEWNYMIRGRYPTKLQHRIKRLGVYTMLIEGQTPEYSANFMKKMDWKTVNEYCKVDGFEIKGEFMIDHRR